MRSREWHFLGCLSFEARCIAAARVLHGMGALNEVTLFNISDVPESRFADEAGKLRATRAQAFEGICHPTLQPHELFELPEEMRLGIASFLSTSPENVILDITTFPKRFFFPLLKWLLESPSLATLLVTYTTAPSYETGALSEDPEPLTSLPRFGGRYPKPKVDAVTVALGFQPLGLAELLEGADGTVPVHFVYAYASEPRARQRVWEFLRGVSAMLPEESRQPVIFVSPRDVSESFDVLVSLSDNMTQYMTLAPYGPKPISLAMALAGIVADWPIFYTQPRVYNPNYSSGTGKTHAYLIRADGRDLYTRPAPKIP